MRKETLPDTALCGGLYFYDPLHPYCFSVTILFFFPYLFSLSHGDSGRFGFFSAFKVAKIIFIL